MKSNKGTKTKYQKLDVLLISELNKTNLEIIHTHPLHGYQHMEGEAYDILLRFMLDNYISDNTVVNNFIEVCRDCGCIAFDKGETVYNYFTDEIRADFNIRYGGGKLRW